MGTNKKNDVHNVHVKIIKSRTRQGTRSMEITLPVEVVDSLQIRAGDYFEVTYSKENNEIKYRKINF